MKDSTRYNLLLYINLFSILIIIKLTGRTTLSWWWILSPLWFPVISVVIILCILVLGYFILKYIDRHGDNNRRLA